MAREELLTEAFVDLADTLVSDYDVADLLHGLAEHCVVLLDVESVGILLTDQRGSLQLLASSSEETRILELFQLQANEGPCLDAFHSGRMVGVADLHDELDHWPEFAPAALRAGYVGVHALPLRLRDETIGALNLFTTSAGVLTGPDLLVARAMGDVATIGILQERVIARSELLIEQLQGALTSRVVIEQAKGVIAAATDLDTAQAFNQLRRYARDKHIRLVQVSHDIVDGTLPVETFLAHQPDPTQSG
jgi:transcriptional regulator with GAF, ATPase, and Fis domain